MLLLVGAGVATWLLTSLLVEPHHDLVREDVEVRDVGRGQVTLERTKASERPGVFGLAFPNGHAVVSTIVRQTDDSVTRRLSDVTGRLAPGVDVAFDSDVFAGNPRSALNIPYRNVPVPDPLGPMPAWHVPGRGSTWVIFVHGIDGTRAGGLRVLPPLHDLRLPTLLVSYRNDPGAPRSPDGLIHLGQTEWQDVQAAVAWARRQGARRFVLYGDSMGGAIVTRFMHVSRYAAAVRGLVLDAPALDWRSIIDGQASRYHLPFMAAPVEWTIGWRIDFDWDAMDEIAQARSFKLPILLFQGLADPLVPPADSAAFARRARPGLVTYVTVPRAGHIQSWNLGPRAYDGRLTRFLRGRLGLG